MLPKRRRDAPILLIEPDINAVSRRFGLPAVANYPPLAQVRLTGQIDDPHVAIVDLRIPRERKGFAERLRSSPPALVGISLTFTSNGDEAIRIASTVRQVSPETVIVLGGTGASEDPSAFYESDVDFIGYRQGDESLAELVREIRKTGAKPGKAPGFFHREGGVFQLEAGAPAPAMPSLAPYAWDRLPSHYWKHYFQGYRPTGIGQMSEGCPFDCTFCSVWKVHGRSVNVASLENLGILTLRSPWLLPNILKVPSHLKNLTRAEMYLRTHREVQGERLLV